MGDDIHPEVAAPLQEARQLISIMDDQLHKMNNATFTGTDESRSVEVTLDGQHRMTDVFISAGLLRQGAQTVEQRLHEALRNATTAAIASVAADQKYIDELITELNDGWQLFRVNGQDVGIGPGDGQLNQHGV